MTAPTIAPGTTKIGWIGTGVMGSSMLGHLIDAGFEATVYTRSKSKADSVVKKGATWVDSPKAVAEASASGNPPKWLLFDHAVRFGFAAAV